jgi:DNA integrity scanning protein DisA with diadenylate cyclase activity
MSSIVSIILPHLIRLVIWFLLNKTSVGQVLGYIQQAEEKEKNDFSKRGYVLRNLKTTENDLSNNDLNTIVELGVKLWKLNKK